MRYIPDLLTVMRMLGSLSLLFVEPVSGMFLTIYALCGVSDALDGYIARKTNSASEAGASLDSMADFLFIGVLLLIFIPILQLPVWILSWVAGIALIRGASLLVGWFRYSALAFIHTYANKAAGLLLFCFPFLYYLLGLTATASLLCIAASLSALEELAINIRSQELKRDARYFQWKR
ncbi:CDP-alcohol phosphatidyltransferase [Paenibacillus sp. FSL R7-0273]|uniref:CDP-alcohol phosphatidyltransferase family protein n=1 Tax=Paenibacillus sp. FSL R7-0273 TaxID=1536772 RepID=UPI0004F61475|nr:CDP-alcohol phosphatidyltransferase family protein [Paenibacillus sp. FSL R7-0273]AIQ46308.1 CDP-alcohol phosphatidyltransferase [Paenibacillus sp. FSL R7-0273]OMF89419.1 CDP-alcohol phosphatidyltransferase [Paenibacillus sp. FSL R7-0273]